MSKIILFNNDNNLITSLEGLFSAYQIQIINVKREELILERSQEIKPDLIILDADLFKQKDFAVCKALKNKRKTKHIPLLLLMTEKNDADIRKICLDAGADDCLIKPFKARKLVTQTIAIIKRTKLHEKMDDRQKSKIEIRTKLSQEIEDLHLAHKELEQSDIIDETTGLYNKPYLLSRLKDEFHRAIRYETPLSLVVLDLDAFGRINDDFGHDVGDYILLKIANVLLINSRIADIVGRLDGADFAVIMPGINVQGGIFEAERLRVAINQTEYIDNSLLTINDGPGRKMKLEISISSGFGVASLPVDESVKNELDFFNLAKNALGIAKTKGKNKTVSSAELN